MSDVLIGNNLAILVAAHELARRGRGVTLLSEGRPFGGHFAGVQAEGHDFDLGMVFMEQPAHPAPSDDFASYDAAVRTDCARFTSQVAAFIEATSESALHRVPTPQCLVGGGRHADYMMANRTDAFFDAPVAPPHHAAGASRAHPLHASNKARGAAFDSATYAQAAAHNHGAEAQAHFFAPFARKLMGGADIPLLARYHRAAWLPLYYPETIAAAMASPQGLLAEYPFYVPAEGSTASWVQALRDRTLAMPGVSLVADKIAGIDASGGSFRVALEGGRAVQAARLAIGVVGERMAALTRGGPLPGTSAASVRILLCLVPQQAIGQSASCLVVVDADRTAYRITDLDAAADRDAPLHRIAIEAGVPVGREESADALDAAMLDDAAHLLRIATTTSIRVLKAITARNAVVLPTHASVSAHACALAAWQQALPGAVLTGPLLAPGAGSMNDQVVQGLKIAAKWS